MKRLIILAPLALLGACGGGSPVESVAPTPETIAFLRIDPAALRGCVDVESVVVDGVAGLITGSEDAAMASAVRTGFQRCGETAQLIDVAGRPPHERPRAEACQRAFAAARTVCPRFQSPGAYSGAVSNCAGVNGVPSKR